MSRDQHAERSHDISGGNKSFETVKQFKYMGTTLTNQNSIHEETESRRSHEMLAVIGGRICSLPVFFPKTD